MKKVKNEVCIYIINDKEQIEIKDMLILFLPRIQEKLFYNGREYLIKDVIHHYKNGFKPYIELIVDEINKI